MSPTPATDQKTMKNAIRPPLAMRRRLLFVGVYVCFLAGLVWSLLSVYGWLRVGRPSHTAHLSEADIWEFFYPKVWESGVMQRGQTSPANTFEVLLLGGSVLEQVAANFEDALEKKLDRPVRVYDVCASAHTTRDSYHKFQLLADRHFDLIVIYHGINDVRMNCCPESLFQNDYTHCAWYRGIKTRVAAGRLGLIEVALDELSALIPIGRPEEDFLEYGRVIKTEAPFRNNLEAIIRGAKATNTPVLLMSFACYIPDDYTARKFEAGELDYGAGKLSLPVELWGFPENVTATVDVHNRVIKDLADDYDNVIFVDMADELPQDGRHFIDCCHLTETGINDFVSQMLSAVLETFKPLQVVSCTPGIVWDGSAFRHNVRRNRINRCSKSIPSTRVMQL